MPQEKTQIVCNDIYKPFGNYSHGVLNQQTGLLVTSGQLGIRKDGSIPDTFLGQTKVCFSNLKMILEEANFTIHDIMRINAFVTMRENFKDYMNERDNFLVETKIKPASTLVVVTGFTKAEFLVEVELTAQK